MSCDLESERPLKINAEPWVKNRLPCLHECVRRTKQEHQVPFDVARSVIVNYGEQWWWWEYWNGEWCDRFTEQWSVTCFQFGIHTFVLQLTVLLWQHQHLKCMFSMLTWSVCIFFVS